MDDEKTMSGAGPLGVSKVRLRGRSEKVANPSARRPAVVGPALHLRILLDFGDDGACAF